MLCLRLLFSLSLSLLRLSLLRMGCCGAGNIKDVIDWLGGGFFVDGLEAAEDVAEGVGDDGGAAWREAALSDENDEVGEDRGDVLGSLEGRSGPGGAEEIGGEVGGVVKGVRSFTDAGGVDEAEAGVGVLDGEAAAAVGVRAVAAAVCASGGVAGRWSCCGWCLFGLRVLFHFDPQV